MPQMRSAPIEATATLTSKGQFTLPKPMRDAIGLSAGETVHCVLREGTIMVTKADAPHEDPALSAFLGLLEADIAKGALQALPAHLQARMRAAATAEIDLDAPIEGDVDL